MARMWLATMGARLGLPGVVAAALLASACQTKDGGGGVTARARIIQGASATTSSTFALTAAAPDGRWALSPDRGSATVLGIDLFSVSGGGHFVEMEDCAPEFDRSQPSLAQIADCAVVLPEGTYAGVGFRLSTTFRVLVHDTANGIHTDPGAPTRLTSVAPAGGAQFIEYTIPGFGDPPTIGVSQYFSEPWEVVAAGDGTAATLTLTVVADMVHTMFANFSGGSGTIDEAQPNVGVQLIPSPSGAGRVELYSPTATAGNVSLPGASATDFGSIRLFYANPPQPSYVFFVGAGGGASPSGAWAADPATAPDDGTGSRAGGYLGQDSTGKVCWAVPQDYTWQQYVQVCELQPAAQIGQSTQVRCQTMAAAPAPISGPTYASGCPAITPDVTFDVTLVAR